MTHDCHEVGPFVKYCTPTWLRPPKNHQQQRLHLASAISTISETATCHLEITRRRREDFSTLKKKINIARQESTSNLMPIGAWFKDSIAEIHINCSWGIAPFISHIPATNVAYERKPCLMKLYCSIAARQCTARFAVTMESQKKSCLPCVSDNMRGRWKIEPSSHTFQQQASSRRDVGKKALPSQVES